MPNSIGTRFKSVGRAWEDTAYGCQLRLSLTVDQLRCSPLTGGRQHEPSVVSAGAENADEKPEPTTMPHFEISAHGSEKLVQHSNR